MGQVLHGSARTTEAVRRAIQRSGASVRAGRPLRDQPDDPAEVAKAGERQRCPDGAEGHSFHRLTAQEEAMMVAFRCHMLLPLDDCLYVLQPTIPHLTRSSLHRCLQRHGISRLPVLEGEGAEKKRFKAYPIGSFHIDIAEVRIKEGKLHLYVGIDRTAKFALAQLHEMAGRPTAVAFLEALIEAVPYNLHTVLTDNGMQFDDLPHNRAGPTARWRVHRFDQICCEHGIEHRLTKANHPWINGQVTSATGVAVSACFSANAISSSVYLNFFTACSSLSMGHNSGNSPSNWWRTREDVRQKGAPAYAIGRSRGGPTTTRGSTGSASWSPSPSHPASAETRRSRPTSSRCCPASQCQRPAAL